MVNKGSKLHKRTLKKCLTSPPSKTCRKHVFHSKGMKIKMRDGSYRVPRNGTMTQKKLRKNKHRQYVSKKKSLQGIRQYNRRGSALREWNEAARVTLSNRNEYSSDGYVSGGYEDFDDFSQPSSPSESYVPFVASPRRGGRQRKQIAPGELSFHGTNRPR